MIILRVDAGRKALYSTLAGLSGKSLTAWVLAKCDGEEPTAPARSAPEPKKKRQRCRACGGVGEVTMGDSQEYQPCPACSGSGFLGNYIHDFLV